MRLSLNNFLWDYPLFLFSMYINQGHLQDERSTAQETWWPLYVIVISNVRSFATGENTLREEQGNSEEIITSFSNSLENIVKNSAARRGSFLQKMNCATC